ncbi:hypothetical protein, partial [Flavobacterium sp.]|uniref:hypothetical protein n=1 Tax=Flavobacterium sp. TaxID=239 RepID=UPI0026153606
MKLFDDIIRQPLSDAQGKRLTKYQQLNQLESEGIDEERNRINQLFDIIDDEDKAKFKKDLVSDYDSGKFELEVYENFMKYGFKISK